MSDKIVPSKGFVLIRPITETKTMKSGITIPDSAPKGNLLKGTIISELEESVVLFRKYNAEEIDGLYLVESKDILGEVITNE